MMTVLGLIAVASVCFALVYAAKRTLWQKQRAAANYDTNYMVSKVGNEVGAEALIVIVFLLLFLVGLAKNAKPGQGQHTPMIDAEYRPPQRAEFLLCILVPQKNREVILGDMEEDYRRNVQHLGMKRARFIYWCDVAKSTSPFLGALLRSLLKEVVGRLIP